MSPQKIVAELDKYIVGQKEAKRAVAIALRHREQRRKLPQSMGQEVRPRNILMIGPTGVGKTEMSRRIASLVDAPFVKAEATKFTEVGYVGRDVESIIHDLVEESVNKVYTQKLKEVESKAEGLATERLLNYLCQQMKENEKRQQAKQQRVLARGVPSRPSKRSSPSVRRFVARLLQEHQLDDQLIEVEVPEMVEEVPENFLPYRPDEFNEPIGDFTEKAKSEERPLRWRKLPVKEAKRLLTREEASKLLDFPEIVEEALKKTEDKGVVFLDELDKIIGPRVEIGRDVSGEGVQRDLLPIVEGTTVMTRYGPVKTDYILFIAAGAFYQNRPSDLIPEMQGRFPLRVELSSLTQEDLAKILVEPENSLVKQHQALLGTEGIELVFQNDAIEEIALMAQQMNEQHENIGARRLNTIMEKVLEDINYATLERKGERIVIDSTYVSQHMGDLLKNEDLNRYIL